MLVARGTTTIVCDPHELANALGADGVHWLIDACDGLPLDVLVIAPSSVPGEPVRVAARQRSRWATSRASSRATGWSAWRR